MRLDELPELPFSPRFRRIDSKAIEFGSAPILLVGAPPLCSGRIVVRNPLEENVRIKGLTLSTSADALEAASRLSEAHFLRAAAFDGRVAQSRVTSPVTAEPERRAEKALYLRVSTRLLAGEAREVRVDLPLPMNTAPGSYEAKLEGSAGGVLPVVVQVLEKRALRIQPAAITREVHAGEVLTLRVNVTNLGNVPVEIPKGTPLHFHRLDRSWNAHFHAAAKEKGSEGYVAFLDDFVARMGDAEPPLGRAKIREGAGTLEPLEGRWLELELHVPKPLPAGREYQALIRLANASFRLQMRSEPEPERDAPIP